MYFVSGVMIGIETHHHTETVIVVTATVIVVEIATEIATRMTTTGRAGGCKERERENNCC